MSRVSKPMHLVERAVQRARDSSGAGPESVLLPEQPAGRTAASARSLPERDRDEIARAAFPAAPYARTLATETLEGAGMVVSREHRSRIAEEFRIVSQQVLAAMASPESSSHLRNLVMVTSARPGEGKSFAALNLAASLAVGGDRTVILADADIRSGSVSEQLGLAAEPGLLDLTSSPSQLAESTLVRSRMPSLYVLPIGGGTDPNGRSLVSTHSPIAGLLTTLANRFADSLFVVDAPACLSSSDPAALAAIAGHALLVVEAEKTRRREIEAALDLIDACPNIKLLLNKARLSTRETFGIYS